MTEIAGKVALVTGGGSGIGLGLVKALADEGASVVVADIVKERADEAAGDIQKAGGSAVALACDVSTRDGVRKMKAEANEAFGRVSLLFANAGVTWFDRLTDMSDNEVDWVLQVNLMGTMYCMQAFLPDMIDAHEGHVVATASNAGLNSGWVPYHVPYATSKSGIIAMMLDLRIELSEVGVGSTVYCPGGVRGENRREHSLPSGAIRWAWRGEPRGCHGQCRASLGKAEHHWILRARRGGATCLAGAVRENSPMVVDHSNQRWAFYKHFVDHAVAAFDDAEAWERSIGRSESVGL